MRRVPQKDLNRALARLRRELALIDQAIRALTLYRAPSPQLAVGRHKLSGASKLAISGDPQVKTDRDPDSHE